MNEITSVGIVGIGQIGSKVADLVAGAGYEVARIDRASSRGESQSIGEQSQRLDALCISVPGPEDVLAVVADYMRLEPALRPPYLVNLSTIGPRYSDQVDERVKHEDPSAIFAECPITGGVVTVSRHEATVLYGSRSGAPDEQLARLLQSFARRIIDLGNVEAASIAKLVNNLAAVSIGLSTLEAFELGVRNGLSVEHLFDVISAGTGNSYILHNSVKRALLEGDGDTGFKACWAHKDMGLAIDLMNGSDQSASYAEIAAEQLAGGMREAKGDLSFVAAVASDVVLPDSLTTERECRDEYHR